MANTGLGGPAAAFLIEELAAYGVHTIIRLGTSDNNSTVHDLEKIFAIKSEMGLVGLMQDYGYPREDWGMRFDADPTVIDTIQKTAANFPKVETNFVDGYNTDGYYAFNFPENIAYNVTGVQKLIQSYIDKDGGDRDMESASLFMISALRNIRCASVLQCVLKGGSGHEGVGKTGIPIVLETLKTLVGIPPTGHASQTIAHK